MIIGDNNGKMAFSMDASYISRDAYVGALCAYSNKRRIEVSYTSFSRSHDLRFLVGDMVRHAENRLRGSIGVRSRLTTHFLDHDMKDALDAWLDVHLPKCSIPQVASKNQPRPAYEALYDSPRTEISLALADEIEKSSWETTRILTEAFEDDTSVENPVPADTPKEETPPMVPQTPITSQGELMDALGDKVNFLRAVMAEDRAAQNAYCQATRELPDAVVDEINDITTNVEIFDMVIEDVGGMYAVIEDYRLMLTKLLNGDDGYE